MEIYFVIRQKFTLVLPEDLCLCRLFSSLKIFVFLRTYVLNFCALAMELISVHLLSGPLMYPHIPH